MVYRKIFFGATFDALVVVPIHHQLAYWTGYVAWNSTKVVRTCMHMRFTAWIGNGTLCFSDIDALVFQERWNPPESITISLNETSLVESIQNFREVHFVIRKDLNTETSGLPFETSFPIGSAPQSDKCQTKRKAVFFFGFKQFFVSKELRFDGADSHGSKKARPANGSG